MFFFGEHHVPLAGEYVLDNDLYSEVVGATNKECGESEYWVNGYSLLQKSKTRKKTGLLYLDHHFQRMNESSRAQGRKLKTCRVSIGLVERALPGSPLVKLDSRWNWEQKRKNLFLGPRGYDAIFNFKTVLKAC